MRPSRLRHKITIQHYESTQDPVSGEDLQDWVDLFPDVRAEIVPLSVREFIAAGAEQAEVTTRMTIRYKDVRAKMRVIHKGRIYNIAGALPDPKYGIEYLSLACNEGVNNG